MEDREQLQHEVLKELVSYSENLIQALEEVVIELRGKDKEDTNDFLNEVIMGINWEIEVYNQCAALINAKTDSIEKKVMVQAVRNLGVSINSGEELKIADCLENDFLPFLNNLAMAAKLVVE